MSLAAHTKSPIALRGRLRPDIASLMEGILHLSGGTLGVRTLRPGEAPLPDVSAGLEIYSGRATLLVTDVDAITPDDDRTQAPILHELLHLHRYWIEGIPQLVGLDPAMRQAIGLRENSLEHFVIVPRQAEFGLREEAYWNKGAHEDWFVLSWPDDGPAGLSFRRRAMMAWLRTCLVTDPALVAAARTRLETWGLIEEAESFKARALAALGQKEALVEVMIQAFAFDRSRLALKYFGSPSRPEMLRRL